MAMVSETAYTDSVKEYTQIMSEFEAVTDVMVASITAAKEEQVDFLTLDF